MLRKHILSRALAGHSHYHNIRYRKARVDKLRQVKLQRISQEIRSAISTFGENDPKKNPRLARVLDTARKASMSKDRIESALQHAARTSASSQAELAVYEGVFPAGIAIVARAYKDRPVAVAADLRSMFTRAGGAFGKAMWMFEDRMTVVVAPQCSYSVDSIVDLGIDEGAEDVEKNEDGAVEFYCASLKDRERLRQVIVETFPELDRSNVYTMRDLRPKTTIQVHVDFLEKFVKLLSALDEHPEIVHVVHNMDITEDE